MVQRIEGEKVELSLALVYLGCLSVTWLAFRAAGDRVTLSDACFGLAMLLVAFQVGRRPDVASSASIPLALLLVVGVVVTGFRTEELSTHLVESVRLLIVTLALPWVLVRTLTTWDRMRVAMGLWVVGATVDALLAVAQTRGSTLFMPEQNYYGRITGFADHPSDAGGMLAIVLPVALALALDRARGVGRVAWLACAGLIGIGVVLSGSVASMIAVVVACAVLAVKMRARLRMTVLAVIAGAVVVRFATSQQVQGFSLSPLERLRATTAANSTRDQRVVTWEHAQQWIEQNPFVGFGLGSEAARVPFLDIQVHNILLLMWVEGGILVAAAVLFFLIRAARVALIRTEQVNVLHAALAASGAAAVTFAMTAPVFGQRYFWLLVALLIACRSLLRQTTPTHVAAPAAPLTVQR